jgi:polygalacturonase
MKLSVLLALALTTTVWAHDSFKNHGARKLPKFLDQLPCSSPPRPTRCVVSHTDNADDAPAVRSAVASCATNGVIEFEQGVSYNIWSPVYFENLVNSTISIQGNLTLPNSISSVQDQIGNDTSTVGNGYWFVITGDNVVVEGNKFSQEWGWIECYGEQWWTQESPSYTLANRPHLMYFDPNNAFVDGLKISQPIGWVIAANGKNMHFSNIEILAQSDNPAIFPFNTDGFDVSGTNILVEHSHVVNGDDCFTLNNGATNIVFRDSFCANGHGVSIGSLDDNAHVQNFTAENIHVKNALYGARFKAYLNGDGTVENVLYRNFYTENCTIPIYITQSYYDQETSAPPSGTASSWIDLIDFNFTNFHGTINGATQYAQVDASGTWWDVPGLTGRDAIVMQCPNEAACAGLHFSNIDIQANFQSSRTTEVWCQNGDNATLGFQCVNGTLVMN